MERHTSFYSPRPESAAVRQVRIIKRRLQIHLMKAEWYWCHVVIDQAARQSQVRAEKIGHDTPLVELELPIKIANKLEAEGITTVGQLLAVSPDELRQLGRIGPQALESLRDRISRAGIRLPKAWRG